MSDQDTTYERLLEEVRTLRARLAQAEADVTARKRAEEALRESEARYRRIVETACEGIWTIDADDRTDYVNRRTAEMLGYAPEEVLGRSPLDFLFPDDVPQGRRNLDRRRQGVSEEGEIRLRRKDGTALWCHFAACPILGPGGEYRGALSMNSDVTRRRQAEEALRESEGQHRLIAELTSDYAYTCRVDPDGAVRMESVTEGFPRITGYTREEAEARGGWASLIHPDDLPATAALLARLLSGQRDVSELRLLTRDGQVRWIRFSFHPVWDPAQGRVVRLLGAVQDVTQRRQAEEQLRESNRQLRALSRRLLEVQEQERRQLGRDLHDEVGQGLTGLRLALQQAARLPAEALPARLEEAAGMVRELAGQVRELWQRLRPSMLDDLGLVPALVWLFGRYEAQAGKAVRFENGLPGGRLPPCVETTAYRVTQEALTNVARHAGVTEAVVRVGLDGDLLRLEVEDRGTGFDVAAAFARGATGGLAGMRERAELLGGRLVIESRPGSGTRVTAELPAREEAEAGGGPDA